MTYKIAAASGDGWTVNQHFGRTSEFTILSVDDGDGSIDILEKRCVAPPCRDGTHDVDAMQAAAQALSDCDYLLASRVGPGAAVCLEEAGVAPYELPGSIEDAVEKLLNYIEIQKLLS